MDRECFDIACVAGACKTWVQERTGRHAYLPRKDKTFYSYIVCKCHTIYMYKRHRLGETWGVLPYIRGICRPKGYGFCQELRLLFLRRFGLKTGIAGADPGFFRGGGALVSCSTSTPINHIVFFFLQNTSCIRKPQVISGGRGGAHPLHPPPRSAPE